MHTIEQTASKVDITGFDEHTIKVINLSTAAAYVEYTSGPIIVLAHPSKYDGEEVHVREAL